MATIDEGAIRPEPYARFRARAARLCAQRAQVLKARAFPPWYVRWSQDMRGALPEALALGTLTGVAIALAAVTLRQRLGDRGWALTMAFLGSCAALLLACWAADRIWRHRHPDHPYLGFEARDRAIREATDVYVAQQCLLDGLAAAFGAEQIRRLKALVPADHAAYEARRNFWSIRRRTFRREYGLALARWEER